MKLIKDNILLNQVVKDKYSAIYLAGELLYKNGYVKKEYIKSMIDRENIVSTYMGNFIAIPHGTDEAKKEVLKTGISIIQIPDGVSFSQENKNMVFIIFGIAGIENEHLDILSKIALFCQYNDNVMKLVNAKTKEEIISLIMNGN